MKNLRFAFMLCRAACIYAGCAKNNVSKNQSLSQALSNNAVIPELSTCKIRRIYQDGNSPDGTPVNALFTYNPAGNPISVVYSNQGTGVFNHYFFYDAQKRLTEYQQSFSTFPVIGHYYKYNTSNVLVKDLTVRINAGNGETNSVHVATIGYDAQGRIIKETIVNTYSSPGRPVNPVRRPTYTYDARGNLAVAGWKSSSYDNKVNPLRQNAILQFIHRNYSNNNDAVQAKYIHGTSRCR